MANEWLERELEDFIVANPNMIGQLTHETGVNKAPFVYLGRQIKCTVGIIDLLFHASRTIFVVELKAVRATAKDLGQALRYSNYIRENLYDFVHHGRPSHFNALIHRFVYSDLVSVTPILIAPSYDAMAASLTHVLTLRATKTPNGFSIEGTWEHNPAFDDQQLRDALAPYAKLVQQETLEKARFDAERDARKSVERRLTEVN